MGVLLSLTVGCVLYPRVHGLNSVRVDLVGETFSQYGSTVSVFSYTIENVQQRFQI